MFCCRVLIVLISVVVRGHVYPLDTYCMTPGFVSEFLDFFYFVVVGFVSPLWYEGWFCVRIVFLWLPLSLCLH